MRAIALLVSFVSLVACADAAPTESYVTLVPPPDEQADGLTETRIRAEGATVWLQPALRPVQVPVDGGATRWQFVLAGRFSRNLAGVISFVPDDVFGAATAISARKFEVAFDAGHELSTLAYGMPTLLGLAGLYARQVDRAGWLGLIGYLVFSLFYLVTASFQFVEALVSPVLANVAPAFVESFLGIVTGHAGAIQLGTLTTVYQVTGGLYMLGSVLFGVATFRARILPRWAAILLAFSGPLAAVVTAVFSHPIDRLAALPMGLALAGLGLALLVERRGRATETIVENSTATVRQAGA